jgi:hypothetical protein
VQGRGLFKCPNADGAYQQGNSGPDYDGYGMNRFVAPESGTKIGFIKYAKLRPDRNPARRRLQANQRRHDQGLQHRRVQRRHVAVFLRHGRQIRSGFNSYSGACYLFPDGHAEWSEEYHNTGHMTPGNKWTHPL